MKQKGLKFLIKKQKAKKKLTGESGDWDFLLYKFTDSMVAE